MKSIIAFIILTIILKLFYKFQNIHTSLYHSEMNSNIVSHHLQGANEEIFDF